MITAQSETKEYLQEDELSPHMWSKEVASIYGTRIEVATP